MTKTKKRGIVASRSKLENALAQSDLPKKTQAALAERIADNENLPSAPKDLVSKAFRELPVDPQTIERIAHTLGVEAYTLYQSSTDTLPTRAEKIPSKRTLLIPVALSVSIFMFLIGIFAWYPPASIKCQWQQLSVNVELDPDRLTILLARFGNDESNQVQQYFAQAFANEKHLKSAVQVIRLCDLLSEQDVGNQQLQIEKLHEKAKNLLAKNRGDVLIWGKKRLQDLIIRITSPAASEGDGGVNRYTDVSYSPTQLPDITFQLGQAGGVEPIVRAALQSALPATSTLAKLKDELLSRYESSHEWLRQSISAERKYAQSIKEQNATSTWLMSMDRICANSVRLAILTYTLDDFSASQHVCRQVLSQMQPEKQPTFWASTVMNLATSLTAGYAFLPTVDARIEQITESIRLFSMLEEKLTPEVTPIKYEIMLRNKGNAFIRLGELDEVKQNQHLEMARLLVNQSLKMNSKQRDPLQYATVKQNECAILFRIGTTQKKDAVKILRQAQNSCREARDIFDPQRNANLWAKVTNNLAISYALIADVEQNPGTLEESIDLFIQAKDVYTLLGAEVEAGIIEGNLGELYCNLAKMRKQTTQFTDSLGYIDIALATLRKHAVLGYVTHFESLKQRVLACQQGDDMDKCVCSI